MDSKGEYFLNKLIETNVVGVEVPVIRSITPVRCKNCEGEGFLFLLFFRVDCRDCLGSGLLPVRSLTYGGLGFEIIQVYNGVGWVDFNKGESILYTS